MGNARPLNQVFLVDHLIGNMNSLAKQLSAFFFDRSREIVRFTYVGHDPLVGISYKYYPGQHGNTRDLPFTDFCFGEK